MSGVAPTVAAPQDVASDAGVADNADDDDADMSEPGEGEAGDVDISRLRPEEVDEMLDTGSAGES